MINLFERVPDKLHNLGFIVLSSNLYQLYMMDLSQSSSLIIEGEFNKQKNCFLYDFYMIRYNKSKNQTYGMKVYCESVRVNVMYHKVCKYMKFLRETKEVKHFE